MGPTVVSTTFPFHCKASFSSYADVVEHIGWTGYLVNNIGYVLSLILGVAIGHTGDPTAGAGVGFSIFIACNILVIILSKLSDSKSSGFFGKNNVLSKMWWFSFYSACYNWACQNFH